MEMLRVGDAGHLSGHAISHSLAHFALAALVPNAFPIIIVLGAMGICGMHMDLGAAMIAAVSMGLSVDSSIHYLLHYQRRLHDGDRPLKALRSAQENVGFAVVLATIALIAGFLALAISEFIPTVVFGALTSLTMLGGPGRKLRRFFHS